MSVEIREIGSMIKEIIYKIQSHGNYLINLKNRPMIEILTENIMKWIKKIFHKDKNKNII